MNLRDLQALVANCLSRGVDPAAEVMLAVNDDFGPMLCLDTSPASGDEPHGAVWIHAANNLEDSPAAAIWELGTLTPESVAYLREADAAARARLDEEDFSQ
jgi:hypothetical protein